MRGLSIILFIGFICGIVKILHLKQERTVSRYKSIKEKEALRNDLNDVSERLTIYYLITLEQNNIIDKFSPSRNDKLNNDKLTNLMQKL